ncbi:MAG: DEAD/DEAH box helicase [Marinifilaceae bacterium]|jgi:ATP-dependent RNA helicase DeaD|nr:DEAD/DEAH box helicase [Marinifilaceae bacterium]
MANFKELGVEESILKGITEMGFENATPVQEKVIPVLLEEGGDLVALAQTGTGKTAAFGLPIIQKIDVASKDIQAVILSPTRELCLQISKDLMNYGKYVNGLRVLAVYGGTDIRRQISSLKRGVNILVATPGRLLDLIRRGDAKLSNVSSVILDEADEMLNMGFKEDLNSILAEMPETRQTLLFSATMPRDVESIAKNYMHDAKSLTCGSKNQGSDDVHHSYYMVRAKDCYEVLKRLVDSNPDLYGIVFCRTRQDCRDIASKLVRDGFDADSLHGELSQAQRDHVMQKFRDKSVKLLIATDVAARGLDVNNLTHVFNFNLPEDVESYTHRSGRTGRAGKKGESIAIIHSREKGKLKRIEHQIKKKFDYCNVPTGEEVCKNRLNYFIDKLSEANTEDESITEIYEEFLAKFEHVSKEELIKQMISSEFYRLINSYKNVEDLNLSEKERSFSRRDERDGRRKRDSKYNFSTFAVEVGSDSGLKPVDIIGLVSRITRSNGVEVGAIKIFSDSSKFEVDSNYEEAFNKAIATGIRYQGEVVKLTKSSMGRGGRGNRRFDDKRGGSRRFDKKSGDRRFGDNKGGRRKSPNQDFRNKKDRRRK